MVAAHGVRGQLRAQSYADPPESLLAHRQWLLRRPDGRTQCFELLQGHWDGHVARVDLAGLTDRNAAEQWRGSEVLVDRASLSPPAAGEYYLEDLVGCTVCNLEGLTLGQLRQFLETPGGLLMVVDGERERWLPLRAPCLRRIDLPQRRIEVDWPADF